MRKFLSIAALVALGYLVLDESSLVESFRDDATASRPRGPIADSAIAEAYESRRSNLQVEGSGEVIRILSDDIDGDRHQRFILRLGSGQTLLIAHNIDLAPRVSSLEEGDSVEFFGEYEWNDQGGVIHWTHRDPQRRHEPGWLKHRGRTYQ